MLLLLLPIYLSSHENRLLLSRSYFPVGRAAKVPDRILSLQIQASLTLPPVFHRRAGQAPKPYLLKLFPFSCGFQAGLFFLFQMCFLFANGR